jgi:hypothetical protein
VSVAAQAIRAIPLDGGEVRTAAGRGAGAGTALASLAA